MGRSSSFLRRKWFVFVKLHQKIFVGIAGYPFFLYFCGNKNKILKDSI